MARLVHLHPDNPQPRRVAEIVAAIRAGGVIAYPTDSSYALGCHLGDKRAMDRIHRIRRTDKHHNFTLVCSDLSEIGLYARLDNWAYRLLRAIGIRVPDHPLVKAMLSVLGEPIMSSTLLLPGDDIPMTSAEEIEIRIGHQVEVVVDCGPVGIEPTSVLDLSSGGVEVLRSGRGDVSAFT